MWKKYIFLFSVILFFVGFSEPVFADSCVCSYRVTSALGCNLNGERSFEFGNNFSPQGAEVAANLANITLQQILEPIAQECPGGGTDFSFYNSPLHIAQDTCAQINQLGSNLLGTYQFSFSCRLEQSPENNQQNQNNQNQVAPSNKSNGTVKLINPIGGTEENPQGTFDMRIILGRAVQVVMGLLGSITLGVLFYGGFLWLTSAGNSDKVSKGSKTMLYAVIGLFIIFGSYGILSTIIQGVRGGAIDNTPFGPENDPNALPQSCSSLTVSNCASLDKCTPFRFQFPNDQAIEECIEKNEVGNRCSEMHNDCVNRFGGAQIQDCENEFAECINR